MPNYDGIWPQRPLQVECWGPKLCIQGVPGPLGKTNSAEFDLVTRCLFGLELCVESNRRTQGLQFALLKEAVQVLFNGSSYGADFGH